MNTVKFRAVYHHALDEPKTWRQRSRSNWATNLALCNQPTDRQTVSQTESLYSVFLRFCVKTMLYIQYAVESFLNRFLFWPIIRLFVMCLFTHPSSTRVEAWRRGWAQVKSAGRPPTLHCCPPAREEERTASSTDKLRPSAIQPWYNTANTWDRPGLAFFCWIRDFCAQFSALHLNVLHRF